MRPPSPTAVSCGSPLRNPVGADETLKSVDIKPVLIRGELKLGFTCTTRPATCPEPSACGRDRAAAQGCSPPISSQGYLFTTGFDLLLDTQGKAPRLKQTAATSKGAAVAGA